LSYSASFAGKHKVGGITEEAIAYDKQRGGNAIIFPREKEVGRAQAIQRIDEIYVYPRECCHGALGLAR
jgi:hypothetical protein